MMTTTTEATGPPWLPMHGSIPPPLPVAADTFACHAYKLWNLNTELRRAKSKHAAKRMAKAIANMVPLYSTYLFCSSLVQTLLL